MVRESYNFLGSGMSELNLEACDIMPKSDGIGSLSCSIVCILLHVLDSFYEIQMEVLKDCKLANGNIPMDIW